MKLKDVPVHPAYVVFHDHFDNGAMEIWPATSFLSAQEIATRKQDNCDAQGYDNADWRAYAKLPRRKVYKYHNDIAR
jgi:hypothetical protein